MDLKFNNGRELYELLLPVLETKEIQLLRNDYPDLTKVDIWNYLTDVTWRDENDMHIYKMVSDVLGLDNEEINNYKKNS